MENFDPIHGYWKQIVYENVPEGSFITHNCGCVMKKLDRGRNWNYPTFVMVIPCSEDQWTCHIKNRQIGRESWDFYDEFKDIDMEATFGITDVEANEILREWGFKEYSKEKK